MKKLFTKFKTAPHILIQNNVFNGNTRNSETKKVLADAILVLAKSLENEAPLLVVEDKKE